MTDKRLKTYSLEFGGDDYDGIAGIPCGNGEIFIFPYSYDIGEVIIEHKTIPIEYLDEYFIDKYKIKNPRIEYRAIIKRDIIWLKKLFPDSQISPITPPSSRYPTSFSKGFASSPVSRITYTVDLFLIYGKTTQEVTLEAVFQTEGYSHKNGFMINYSTPVAIEYQCPHCKKPIQISNIKFAGEVNCKSCKKSHLYETEVNENF